MKKRKKSQENDVPIAMPVTRAKTGFDKYGFISPSFDVYYRLRRDVPIIDAAINKLTRLIGNFEIKCNSRQGQCFADYIKNNVEVNGNGKGLSQFISAYFEQLITCGTAVGEIVTSSHGMPCGLYNSPLTNLSFRRADNGFEVEIYVHDLDGERKVKNKEKILMSVLNPLPGEVIGVSMLQGLPYISSILMKIFYTIGENWERAGALRYAVTYKPGNDPTEAAYAGERAKQIAEQWSESMTGGGISDFVTVGDVNISVIGADGKVLDSQVPVRQLLEQIVSKTGLPPFILGLSWSSTERMSSQQVDILTSEIEYYRSILTPVIIKIMRYYLRTKGFGDEINVIWDDITIQDMVAQAATEKE